MSRSGICLASWSITARFPSSKGADMADEEKTEDKKDEDKKSGKKYDGGPIPKVPKSASK